MDTIYTLYIFPDFIIFYRPILQQAHCQCFMIFLFGGAGGAKPENDYF
jgi:hypothetical protein